MAEEKKGRHIFPKKVDIIHKQSLNSLTLRQQSITFIITPVGLTSAYMLFFANFFVNLCVKIRERKLIINLGGARGVMVIIVGNGHGDTSSNPRPD